MSGNGDIIEDGGVIDENFEVVLPPKAKAFIEEQIGRPLRPGENLEAELGDDGKVYVKFPES